MNLSFLLLCFSSESKMVLPKCRDCKKKHSLLNIVCQFCAKNSKESNRAYTCQEKLNKHLKLMHKENIESNDKSEVISKSRALCDICNKSFLKSNLQRHIQSQHEGKKSNEKQKANEKSLKKVPGIAEKKFEEKNKDIASVHEETPLFFVCNVCNKEFAGPETLKIHRRTHTSSSDKQSDSVHENPKFSVPNVKLSWDYKKKTVKNDKGEKVKLQISLDELGYIELPSKSEIDKMEKKKPEKICVRFI